MKRFVRGLLGLSVGVVVVACSGGGDPEERTPRPDGTHGNPDTQGLCQSAAPAVLEASGTLILTGTFQPMGRGPDECLGDAPAMAFAVAVPDDGSLEVRARTSFPASISVREDCEAPGRTALCNEDVGSTSAILPVSGAREVFVTLASLAADSAGKNFEVEVDFHPVRTSGERCDKGFLCEPGTFCTDPSWGFCKDLLQISDPQVFYGGPDGDESIVSFGVSGPLDYVLAYELEITDTAGRSRILPDVHIVPDGQDSFFLQQVASRAAQDLGEPRAARLRVSNGGWTEWAEVEIVHQPVRSHGQGCDPTWVSDRCEVGLACSGPAGGATCLSAEAARLAASEEALRVEPGGSLFASGSNRGLWEIPPSCTEHLPFVPAVDRADWEQVVRVAIQEAGNFTIYNDTRPGATMVLHDRGEGTLERVACFEDRIQLDLEPGEYLVVMKSADRTLVPNPEFRFQVVPSVVEPH